MKFMHLRLPKTPRGGITLAYKHSFPHARIVTVATAVCSPKDVFNKSTGRQIAASNLMDGIAINLPMNKKISVEKQLHSMFYGLLENQELEVRRRDLLTRVEAAKAIVQRRSQRKAEHVIPFLG